MTQEFSATVPLSHEFQTSSFDCGEKSLNEWLRHRAHRNELSGGSRTFVVCVNRDVAGYYCLSSGAVDRASAPKSMQRNMPDPIPVVVMGRLAVDIRHQGKGLGNALLRDASKRTAQVAQTVGVTSLLVQAISENSRQFYIANGFLEFPTAPMTLCLPMTTIRKVLVEDTDY